MERFDLLSTPLTGINLIEASAGTGKTFSIAGLFVRLLLESAAPGNISPRTVNEILVVTFTEAATQELRDRIRRRVRDALDAFVNGRTADRFLQGLLERYDDHERARVLLFGALSSFDEASVFTIHGFCRKMLQDNPFESGSLFDTRLVTDQSGIFREIAEDFWRRTFFSAPPAMVKAAIQSRMGPETLLELVNGRIPGPFLTVIPDIAIPFPATSDEPMQDESGTMLMRIKRDFLRYLAAELPKRKRRDNIRFFDDLLLDLYTALQGEGGDSLAEAIRSRYRAVLIDEFQDTDQVQYAIFDRVFRTGETPVFLIGDPKQAIYSFRGADVFAYLSAAETVSDRYTLEENWRSEPNLVRAVNSLFERHPSPFLLDEIRFHPVVPALKERETVMTFEGLPESSPLTILFTGRKRPDKPIDKQDAWEIIPSAVASEISDLLRDGAAGRLLIDGKGVCPGDIAVLVRKNRQARLMQQALGKWGIPSVLCRSGNLFESPEAAELLRILSAISRPGNEALVKSALATSILGLDCAALETLFADEGAWALMLDDFRRYRDLWDRHGFMVTALRFFAENRVRSRLLPLPGGERSLTNLMHCLEILHQAETDEKHGIDGLLAWLTERIVEEPKREEHEIRLETDEKAVQLVTIHRSKGLEFPVVFCPFSWESGNTRGKNPVFHDREKQVVLDLGSPDLDTNRKQEQAELLAEELRLVYVALTRAKHRSYLVWGAFKDAGESALHYLLHPDRTSSKRQVSTSDNEMLLDLERLGRESGGAVKVLPLQEHDSVRFTPEDREPTVCVSRTFKGPVHTQWRVTSYTSFVSAGHPGTDLPDRDSIGVVPHLNPDQRVITKSTEGQEIFDFPGGVTSGIVIHEILERLFTATEDSPIPVLVKNCLEKYGFDGKWGPPIIRMIDNLLRLPLPGVSGPFNLSSLPPQELITEMEFFFPLKFITADRVKEVIAGYARSDTAHDLRDLCNRLRFTPVKGMVRGFMDMVFRHDGRFYLIDWKSNYLGTNIDDYALPQLEKEMERRLYSFQYLLYVTALVRHLSRVVPGFRYETHFGGVFYLFLRGIDPDKGTGYGVFHDLPSAACIAELTECLIENGGPVL